MDELADTAEKLGDTTTYRHLEALAIDLFNQSGHAHGALDIIFRQTCRNIQEGASDLDKEMELIRGYLDTYNKQEFINGAQNAVGILMNSVASLYSFELLLGLTYMSQELADDGGARLFWILRYAGLLAQWLTHSGRAPRVIEGANVLYSEIQECDCQWLKGFIAQITAQAYFQTGDYHNAMHWSALCKNAWQLCNQMDRAESITMELRSKLNLQLDGDAIERIISDADIEIEEEIKNGLIIPAVEQMDWILTQIFLPKGDKRLIIWLERIEALLSQLSGIDADIKRANLFQARANALLSEAKYSKGTKTEEEVIQILEMAIPLYMKHKRLVEAANTRQMHGLVLYSIFQRSPTHQSLQTALDMFSIVYDAFRNLDISVQISSSSYWCSFLAYQGWCHGWVDAENVLNALLIAESARDQERVELSILGGLEALAGKRRLGTAKQTRDLYNMALQICLQANKPELLWEWLQKAKARSLSDILGLGVLEPEALRSVINSDSVMKGLFEKEKALLRAIKDGDVKDRLTRRSELHSLQKEMQDYPALHAMMDHRDGSPIELADLHSLSQSIISSRLCINLVFVDWFFSNGNVYLCTVKGQELPLVSKCNITQLSIENWKKIYLDSEGGRKQSIISDDLEEDDPGYPLRHLDSLVEPLKDLLDENDLLICSATGILHSIPIHALWVNDEPLITRNPIVYSASMTSFVQCWRRAAERRIERAQVTMMAVFEPSPDTDFHEKEQERIYNEIYDLVSNLDATVITGAAGSHANLGIAIQSSTLFHFHGHCRLDEAIIADQSLVLADGDFSVRDVFNQKLVAPHITLIACDSASQSISAGDEPLGIVTALLCAGASSVLGTIWPTASSTGRNFSAQFYTELRMSPGIEVYNLATALQRAVIEIRQNRRTRHPCHWASFVLHGACFTKALQ